jgi:hypothetical protein
LNISLKQKLPEIVKMKKKKKKEIKMDSRFVLSNTKCQKTWEKHLQHRRWKRRFFRQKGNDGSTTGRKEEQSKWQISK